MLGAVAIRESRLADFPSLTSIPSRGQILHLQRRGCHGEEEVEELLPLQEGPRAAPREEGRLFWEPLLRG